MAGVGGLMLACLALIFARVSCEDFESKTCKIKPGSFNRMIYKADSPMPWYGERCETKPPPGVVLVQFMTQECVPKYCCSQPCTCGSGNDVSNNQCGANATTISCFELRTERNYTFYECCDGHQEIDHTCIEKINCKQGNGGCSDTCKTNSTGNFSYCDCKPGRYLLDFYSCIDAPAPVPLAPTASDGYPIGYIIAAAVGGFLFLLLLLLLHLLLLFLVRRRKRQRKAAVAAADTAAADGKKIGVANLGYDKKPMSHVKPVKVHPAELLKAKLGDSDAYYVDEKVVKNAKIDGKDKVIDRPNPYVDEMKMKNPYFDGLAKIADDSNVYEKIKEEPDDDGFAKISQDTQLQSNEKVDANKKSRSQNIYSD